MKRDEGLGWFSRNSSKVVVCPHNVTSSTAPPCPPRLTAIGQLCWRQADDLHGHTVPQSLVPSVDVERRVLHGTTGTMQQLLVGGHAQVVVAEGFWVMGGRAVDPA